MIDKKFIDLYENSPTITDWVKVNKPDEDLIYKNGVNSQEKKYMAIATLLNLDEPRVVSHHTSKSVCLPVVAYSRKEKYKDRHMMIFSRNNFHDMCCTVLSSEDINIRIGDIYTSTTKAYLEEQKTRALKYVGKCAFDPRPLQDSYMEKLRQDSIAQYRRIAEADDWSWYNKEWSGNSVIEYNGEMCLGEAGQWEGNPGLPINLYRGPAKDFTFVKFSYASLASALEKITAAFFNPM